MSNSDELVELRRQVRRLTWVVAVAVVVMVGFGLFQFVLNLILLFG